MNYSKAIAINLQDAKIYSNRGIAYTLQGQYDLAISDYDKALELKWRSTYFNYYKEDVDWLKADAYVKSGQHSEFIDSYLLSIYGKRYAYTVEFKINEARKRIREFGAIL